LIGELLPQERINRRRPDAFGETDGKKSEQSRVSSPGL
jgi:hypothetical protein